MPIIVQKRPAGRFVKTGPRADLLFICDFAADRFCVQHRLREKRRRFLLFRQTPSFPDAGERLLRRLSGEKIQLTNTHIPITMAI